MNNGIHWKLVAPLVVVGVSIGASIGFFLYIVRGRMGSMRSKV